MRCGPRNGTIPARTCRRTRCLDLDGHRTPPGLPLERGDQPLIGEKRRVDAPGEIAEVLQGLGHLLLGLFQKLVCLCGILRPHLAGQAELHRQRHQLLLRPVVDVALEAPAFLPSSTHHSIDKQRLAEWHDKWDLLGIT